MSPPERPRVAYRVETERLLLRPWEPTDGLLLEQALAAGLEHLARSLPWARREPLSPADRLRMLRRRRGLFDTDVEYAYASLNPAGQRLLGGGGIYLREGGEGAELGYWVRADERGKGYATEYAAALTRLALEPLERPCATLRMTPDNLASARVAAKLGYRLEATLRARLPDGAGVLRDCHTWTLRREELGSSPAAEYEVRAFDALGRALAVPG